VLALCISGSNSAPHDAAQRGDGIGADDRPPLERRAAQDEALDEHVIVGAYCGELGGITGDAVELGFEPELVAPGGGELQPHVAAEARGETLFGVGQLFAFARELALAAIEDVDELEDQRPRRGEQHRPLQRRRMIAPED
jgi:hypothetical protein